MSKKIFKIYSKAKKGELWKFVGFTKVLDLESIMSNLEYQPYLAILRTEVND